ncbi:GntR family transcriptional regulator [Ectobacillus sp. JY-23]|uniref:GntR family transcriptional regulator n=1 Tax=Ectobacillus sp. JY-23 TaxID=2933872 RepID=UPI001FF3DA5D|nr:GntR family transcriptional regulator [Ectobacillus sp. JY-23]UOY93618.1 GntR family transcriptional regulator [Ectobacillus sp. JY-23]
MSIRSDNRHLYLRVIDRIKDDIKEGVYKEKQKLPSEFDLAKELGVSRATLREALRILEEENVVLRRHGVGTFVNATPLFSSGIEQLYSITDMIADAKKVPGTIFLSSSLTSLTEEEKEKFRCTENVEALAIERVRTADGEPVVYCVDKMPHNILPDLSDYKEESLLSIIHRKTNKRVTYAVAHIEPLGYHSKVSPILECDPETALLVLKQMHYDQNDEPILYSLNYFRADKFSFHVLRKRM